MDIGKIIHYHRKRFNLTQQELAHQAGLGKTVIFDIEKGKASVQLDTLLKILEVLEIKISYSGPFSEDFLKTPDPKKKPRPKKSQDKKRHWLKKLLLLKR